MLNQGYILVMCKIKTSFTLPPQQIFELKRSREITRLPVSRLAVLCLKKLLKRRGLRFSNRINIKYNPSEATEKIYPYLSYEEQAYLRSIRSCHAISISYLISIAIAKYLRNIVYKLTKRHNNSWVSKLEKNLTGIHRKIQFEASQITAFTTILIRNRERGSG